MEENAQEDKYILKSRDLNLMRIKAAQFQHLEITSCSISFQTFNTSTASCLSHGYAMITQQLCQGSLFKPSGTQITHLSGNCLLSQPQLRFLPLLPFVYFCFLCPGRGKSLSCEWGPWVRVSSERVLCTVQCVRVSRVSAMCHLGVNSPWLHATPSPHTSTFSSVSEEMAASLGRCGNQTMGKVFAIFNA